ncbi:MAG: ABC transporter ATP-binding protein [Gammaproteobacteria bacterium]
MTKPILQIQQLQMEISTRQGIVRPVDNISFELYPGQTFALVGESGSGKSLTALSILQLLPPEVHCISPSQILFHGKDLLQLPEAQLRHIRGRKIGIVFQEPMTALNPVLTIGYQLKEVIRRHLQLRGSKLNKQAIALLEQVGLEQPLKYLKRYPHQLSGGQRQRVAIAIALAGDPDLLIADEPTTALDVTIQAQILDLLADLQQQRKMGLLLITHDLSVVARLAQDVGVMHSGKMVEQAPAAEFFKHPQNAYSKKLFAATYLQRNSSGPNAESFTILKVKDLQVKFPHHKKHWWEKRSYFSAVDGVSFTLDAGKTLAIVGESGSGKTTIAKALLRLIPTTSGNVELYSNTNESNNLTDLSPCQQAKCLQIVWQDPYSSLDPRQSVKNILAEGLAVHGKQAITEAAINELLEQVGLSANSAHRYPHQFSGGQRQRIAIARALAAKPKILICDEPTSALDVSVQAKILKLLHKLQNEFNLAYLLITHNMSVVEYLADNVAVMYQGHIVEYGPVEQVLNNPQHAYTQQLLSSVLQVPVSSADQILFNESQSN